MVLYNVSFGVTYQVEAESEEDAADEAYNLMIEDWGTAFAHESWSTADEA